MSTVLVTGARGFIGRPCVARLVERGHQVLAPTRSPTEASREFPDVVWRGCDLLEDDLDAWLEEIHPCWLLHLAWITTPGEYWTSPRNRDWLAASAKLLDAFLAHGGKRAVFVGTCAEYDWREGRCTEDSTPLRLRSEYSRSKDELRRHFESSLKATGASGAWARVFWPYGPFEDPRRLIPSVVRSLLRGEPAECSEGTQRRDFMHVDDVAAALGSLLESDVNGTVNIGSGEPVAIRDLALRIGETLGAPELVRLGARPGAHDEPSLVVADPKRLFDEVGFRPSLDLDRGLEHTIAWWRSIEGDRTDGSVLHTKAGTTG